MDANTAGIVAAIGALVGAGAIVWQTRLTTRVQIFLQLVSRWDSTDMQQTRSYAAGCILNKQDFSPHVDDVLDFFETVAMFSKRKHLDDEIVWDTFYWPMACYWCKTESYIREAQKDEGAETWKGYSDVIPVLIDREGGELPGAEAVDQFLNGELRRYRPQ